MLDSAGTYTAHMPGPTPYTLCPAPCTLCPTPCALHPVPYALYPTPCALHPVPCALRPVPCTLIYYVWTCTPTKCVCPPCPPPVPSLQVADAG